MAQDFSLRYPLVDGHGNFGSLDGDAAGGLSLHRVPAAALADRAARASSARSTVDWRPNYDGTRFEPIVLPARCRTCSSTARRASRSAWPPPSRRTTSARSSTPASRSIDDPTLETQGLLKHIKGPDFPTGGQILTSKQELREIYETGQGSLKLRGE